VLSYIRGAGEPIFEYDFSPGADIVWGTRDYVIVFCLCNCCGGCGCTASSKRKKTLQIAGPAIGTTCLGRVACYVWTPGLPASASNQSCPPRLRALDTNQRRFGVPSTDLPPPVCSNSALTAGGLAGEKIRVLAGMSSAFP
jgi:hypothetical protein